MRFKIGDQVAVKPEHDIPAILRPGGKPTTGEVREIRDEAIIVWVPIGDADINEHSQAVPYAPEHLYHVEEER